VILDLSQITSGKLRLVRSELNISELIRGVVDDLAPLLARSGSKIISDIQDNVAGLLNPVAVSQIVENVLSNAIKYGEGKPIELALTSDGGVACITVRDHGIGIDAEAQERIFGRFERAVRKTGQPGFGLGLWVTRKLAEAMGAP
jgi:two-component system OmpR family sensor kinase